MSNWITGKVVAKRLWTDRLCSLCIEADVAPFEAGQFTMLGFDIDGERIGRPYSYVNAPHERPLEFYFIKVPGGLISSRLASLQVGNSVWITEQASGRFTLSEIADSDQLWMLSTGTALGVFLSILKTDEPWERFSSIILVHAARTVEEMAYRDIIQKILERYGEQFRVISFVSRQDTDFAIRGHIPKAIGDGSLEKKVGLILSASQSQVMVCGNKAMVHDALQVLEKRGLKKSKYRDPGQITIESYI